MYFTPAQAQKVVQRLCRAQANGGWLVVGPTELHETNCLPLTAVNFRGKSFYRRGEGELPVEKLPAPVEPAPIRIDAPPVRGRAALFTAPALAAAEPPAPPAVQARSLANQGKLADALDCCQRWITADQFNSAGHYLRAVILEAQGATDAAVQALRAALYLDPNFVLAHFELGSISRRRGVIKEALKHLQIARRLLGEYQPNDVLPESDGVTAGRFIRIVDSLLEKEAA
jgi:chemotaxis protein methyltransferase CheR